MHTITSLKADHKTLAAAKIAYKLKAKSWQSLADKINNDPKVLKARIQELEEEVVTLKKKLATSQEFDPVGFWLNNGNFERSKFGDFGTPAEATYKESVARQFYRELAHRYHPDKGGTNEQMANLKQLEDQMMAMVELNEGLGK